MSDTGKIPTLLEYLFGENAAVAMRTASPRLLACKASITEIYLVSLGCGP